VMNPLRTPTAVQVVSESSSVFILPFMKMMFI